MKDNIYLFKKAYYKTISKPHKECGGRFVENYLDHSNKRERMKCLKCNQTVICLQTESTSEINFKEYKEKENEYFVFL